MKRSPSVERLASVPAVRWGGGKYFLSLLPQTWNTTPRDLCLRRGVLLQKVDQRIVSRKERTIQRGNISFSTSPLHIDTDRWLKPPPESRRTGFFCWSTPGRVSKRLCSAEAGPNSHPPPNPPPLYLQPCLQRCVSSSPEFSR